jgi:hypothetical protein
MEALTIELINATERILELRKREYTHDSNDPVRFTEWDNAFKNLENILKQIKEKEAK